MYEYFNQSGTYKVPTGETITGQEMIDSNEYPDLSEGNWVISISNGTIYSIAPLDQVAKQLGVTVTENLEEVLTNINVNDQKQTEARAILVNNQPVMLKAAKIVALSFTDEQALEVRDLYPVFEIGHDYKKDERFTYNGRLFKVNQDHTSQEQWVPGETGTESLYTSLEIGENGYLNWQQPTGSHDAYNTGDIVNYKGELYKSLIDGNAWTPDVYPAGWEKYTEPTS